jgi:spore maturation protein CgeB
MKVLYIGPYQLGSTSRMRGETITKIMQGCEFKVIDTNQPYIQTRRLFRSMGFRFKKGPLITRVNRFIIQGISYCGFQDLIWVDKAVFVSTETTLKLRKLAKLLVHFTPDPAFTFHASHHFRQSLSFYDFAITTKSYEKKYYHNYLPAERIILTTQGFSHETHQPQIEFSDKKKGVLFIGHRERERELIVQKLTDAGINVALAGIKWEKFSSAKNNNNLLSYLGKGIYGSDYAKTISAYQFSWGALSKWIPELHTTRTFEIPACGTALITERNPETNSYFNEDEAIFYDTPEEMIERIRHYQNRPGELKQLTVKGRERVIKDGRDYRSILEGILKKCLI